MPDLPGCMTTGRTPDETKENIREAIEGHRETLREFGDPVPNPASVAWEVEISPAAQPISELSRHASRTERPSNPGMRHTEECL